MKCLLLCVAAIPLVCFGSDSERGGVLHAGLSTSPSGRYLLYATVRLRKDPSMLFPDFGPAATVTVVDWQSRPVFRLCYRTDQPASRESLGGGWVAGDQLLGIYSAGRGRNRYLLELRNIYGCLVKRKVLKEEFTILATAVAPNGHYLAYTTNNDKGSSKRHLVIRRLKDLHIVARLPMDAFTAPDIVWSPDSRRVAAVGVDFVWLYDIGRRVTRRVRCTEYYSGKVSPDRDILVNYSRQGLCIIPVQEPNRLTHHAVGAVDKFAFSPRADGTFAALVWSNGDRSEAGGGYILVLGTITISGVHIQKELARGTISDFCWHPDGNKIAYLTEDGKVVIIEISVAK